MSEPVRLQKFLARCGIASRRKSEELILSGRVSVNGATKTNLGIKIDPESDVIRFDGKTVEPEKEHIFVLLNKPKGYVTSLSDPQGRPVVTSLVKDIPERLFPVGRLDLDTEGALILTNDGGFAQKVQHPSHETNKTYEALVSGYPGKGKLKQLERGILLEGKQTAPATLKLLKRLQGQTLVQITIHEGRKRQVRKMFDFIGNPVISLKRIAYGKLFLKNLPTGRYKLLNHKDLKKIFL
jgi:23S rRNA pseudouridine2605 synthase